MLLLSLLLACRPDPAPPAPGGGSEDDGTLSLELPHGTLVVDPGGWFDLFDGDGRPVLVHAVGLARLDAADDGGTELRTDGAGTRELVEEDGGVHVFVHGADGAPDLDWWIAPHGEDRFQAELAVVNTTEAELRVAKLAPLRVDAAGHGALFLGQDPARHRILENGSHAALDFVAEVRAGDTEPDAAAAAIAPGEYTGNSVSNGNHAVVDLDGDAAWVAGALDYSDSLPVVQLTGSATSGPVDEEGRRGFSFFSIEADFLPLPLAVAPGEARTSTRAWVAPFEADALLGLEAWAEATAAHMGIVPWHRRAQGRRIPNGWNSWSGSGGTGGYGTDIDEELVLANCDWMAEELRDWGMDWFQVDDGYEPTYGDWTWRTDRFPSGPRALSDAIRERGFLPGLWMAPFSAYDDSQLYAEHPGWFIEKNALGTVVGSDYNMLDLTNPEVQAWLTALTRQVHEDWGFDWYKLDFGYYAMMAKEYDDPGATRESAWRAGMGAVRQGLGEDAFLLSVGAMAPNYGVTDSMRTTLDNAPVWDWDPSLGLDDHMEQQGHKPTVRTAGRRWYLHDRIWISHPDLIIFRSNTRDETWPRVTFAEARAFATYVGLSGGIVKLGDRLLDLDGDEINVLRTLLPTYGSAARPLDVFAREFPEVWHLPVDAPLDGADLDFHLFGLFNWGLNQDLTTEPRTLIEDDGAARQHEVGLPAGTWLAYEFWTGTYLGEVVDSLEVDVPAHDSRVVALRRAVGHPQFLGWNRQLTMGGSVLEEASWDEAAQQLVLRFPVVPGTERAPFAWEVVVHEPAGFGAEDVVWSGVSLEATEVVREDGVLRFRFEPVEVGDVTLIFRY